MYWLNETNCLIKIQTPQQNWSNKSDIQIGISLSTTLRDKGLRLEMNTTID